MPDLPDRISEWLLLLVKSQRSIAHLLINNELVLIQAGGELEYYGLGDLEQGNSASDQLPFLEGLLPLAETPFLLESVGMPGGSVADVHLFADEDRTWVVLLDVTVEHDLARKMQQKAYDMTLLSQREARLIAKLEAAHKELTLTHRNLAESRDELLRVHNRLRQELQDAERYVLAILPAPVAEPIAVDWLFAPSTELGGDSFGYYWIDGEHFALYLLDVCGHGVGSALLSITVANTLRSGALQNTDFRRPEAVLGSLNQAFQMENQNGLYFTIWYGVYHRPTETLRYASAGHPPPIVVSGAREKRGKAESLTADGCPVGILLDFPYACKEVTLAGPARLFLYSDGAYEIMRPDGTMLEFEAFEEVLTRAVPEGASELQELLQFVRGVHRSEELDDDFSIVKMTI
jgi:sigma-B regulation protein RsbU (phosphoserine phosphatase)